MDPEYKKRWIEKLRSGTIKQTRKQLANVEGARCCLGVMCDLLVEDDIITRVTDSYGVSYSSDVLGTQMSGMPTNAMFKAVGINPCCDTHDMDGDAFYYCDSRGVKHIEYLSRCNDAGLTFPQIADLIERFF